ncbi:MAG: hypothetical protein SO159_06685 [Dialister sp.]|nr:hypothetical protein [Dialister sp.]
MHTEKTTVLPKEARIVLTSDTLKGQNFKMLKEMLHLDDSVTCVQVYFTKFKSFGKEESENDESSK